MQRVLQRLRRYLMTGLVVIAPVGVTVYVLAWLFRRLDPIVGRHLPAIDGYQPPGLGLVVLAIMLILVGWASQRAMGRRALRIWNRVLNRVPIARQLYGTSSHVFQAVLSREQKLFRHCALIEYPTAGSYVLVLETEAAPPEMEEVIGEPAVSVFLPTVPNPTSGFLLVLPRSRVHRLGMTVEDGFRMIFSAGVALPDPSPVGVPEGAP